MRWRLTSRRFCLSFASALERLKKQNDNSPSNPRHGCRSFCAGSTSRVGIGFYTMGRPHTVLTKDWLASRISIADSGCWEWQKSRGRFGYGKASLFDRTLPAHRAAWMIYKGEIPPGICVLHKCDNPPCCNPAHLFLGTKKDNAQDCSRKGRKEAMALGMQRRMAVITAGQATEIRVLYKAGQITQAELGKMFGITSSAVSLICTRRNWQNVP